MPTNLGSMGNKNQLNKKSNSVKETEILSRQEKERKLLEEIGSEKPGLSTRKKAAIGAAAGVLGATAVLIPTVKYFVDNQKHIITMKVQGTNYETYKLKVKKGSLVKNLKTYSITGYNFIGFYKDEACTIPYQAEDKVTKSSTVFCKYEPIKYTVTYPTNQEGYVVNAEQTIEYGNKFIFTVTLFDRYDKSDVVVKVNGEAIKPENEYGQYIVSFVNSDINITVENVVVNKPIVMLNFGNISFEIEAEENMTLQEVLEENVDQIILQSITENLNTYTEEQLSKLSLEDLIKVTTAGIFTDETCKEEIDLNITTVADEIVNLYMPLATNDKLAFEGNKVKAKDETIVGKVVIPKAYINNGGILDVNSIYEDIGMTFSSNANITELTIPGSVKNLDGLLFGGCVNLTRVTIATGVTYLGLWMFSGCLSLKEISIPETVTSIYPGVFSGCASLKEIKLPNSLNNIAYSVFEGCSNLTSITIPENVSYIEDYDNFRNCHKLVEIYNLSQIPFNAGDYGTQTNVKIHTSLEETSVIQTDENGWQYIEYESGKYKVLNYVGTEKEITVPASYNGYEITELCQYALSCNENITSITIPKNITNIGVNPFMHNLNLEKIEVDIDNPVYYSEGNCLIEKSSKTLLYGCKNSVIPNTVVAIGENAFKECYGLTQIKIPDSIETIEKNAFDYCVNLENVTIGKNVKVIGNGGFNYCYNLKEINFAKNLTTIGSLAFFGCKSLNRVNIININSWLNINFTNEMSNPLYFAKNLYLNNELVTTLTLDNTITTINQYTFYNCTCLTNITISNTVKTIGRGAFYGCKGLTSITMPNSVTSIGDSAFAYCSSLTSIEIPTSVTSIASGAFSNCTSLTSIEIPNSVTSIGDSAFAYCSSLTSITISNSITTIKSFTFSDCTSLTSLEIPTSVTSIGNYAFSNCTSLTSIEIPTSVTSIGNYAFENCTNLTSVKFNTTSGWKRYSSSTATSGTMLYSTSLANTNTAATWLKSTYTRYYWKRT